jgi:hypothetical protein
VHAVIFGGLCLSAFRARDDPATLRAASARLRDVIEAKDTEIGALRAGQQALGVQVEVLLAEVADLRARLEADTPDSLGLPSCEGLGKPPPRSLRGKNGRRPGRRRASRAPRW